MSGAIPNYPSMQGQPADYKTYAIASPIETHTREASCEEAECAAWQHGWVTRVDTSTELGRNQAEYIESRRHGRSFQVLPTEPGTREYRFASGQRCFAAPHRVALERPAFFIVREGDFRGNPRGLPPVARSVDDWVDDFATHQDKLRDQIEKG